MSDEFDPYYKWLAIPRSEQPPNHYRLLALPLFLDDDEVIENAADQRMAHVRSVQSGPHAALSQRILNEISAARVCLLRPEQKATYDAWLRMQIPAQQIATNTPSSRPQPRQVKPEAYQLPPELPAQPVVVMPAMPPQAPAATAPPLPSVSGNVVTRRPISQGAAGKTRLSPAAMITGTLAGVVLGLLVLGGLAANLGMFGSDVRKAAERPPNGHAPPTAQKPVARTPASPGNFAPHPPVESKVVAADSAPVKSAIEVSQPSSPQESIADRVQELIASRDAALAAADLRAALTAVEALAALEDANALDAKLALVAGLDRSADAAIPPRLIAQELLGLLEQAAAESRIEVGAKYVDTMLALTRKLNDRDLERKATLVALKLR